LGHTAYTWQDGEPATNPTATLITAARLNSIETDLAAVSGARTIAPDPTGGDDTAVLQPLLTAAQTTGGILELRDGNYRANLTTTAAASQPRIIGQGKKSTTISSFDITKPVLRFKGNTATLTGGYIADLFIGGTGGVGIELADVSGVTWSRIGVGGTLTEGIRFHTEAAGQVCEFNTGDAEFGPGLVQAVHYKRTAGDESFRGTGFTAGTVFTQPAAPTQPVILIDAGCWPHSAPLTAAFTIAASMPVIRDLNTTANRAAQFTGAITAYIAGGIAGTLVDDAQTPVYYAGTVNGYAATGATFTQGGLRLNDVTTVTDAGIDAWHKTTKVQVPAAATSPGDLGQWAASTTNLYVVVAQDVWRRVALTVF
jgi:hypothetical protein